MDDQIRLPSSHRKNPKENKALGFYERKGQVTTSKAGEGVLPVSLDAEAMQQLIREIMMKENEDRLEEARLPEGMPLTGERPLPPSDV